MSVFCLRQPQSRFVDMQVVSLIRAGAQGLPPHWPPSGFTTTELWGGSCCPQIVRVAFCLCVFAFATLVMKSIVLLLGIVSGVKREIPPKFIPSLEAITEGSVSAAPLRPWWLLETIAEEV